MGEISFACRRVSRARQSSNAAINQKVSAQPVENGMMSISSLLVLSSAQYQLPRRIKCSSENPGENRTRSQRPARSITLLGSALISAAIVSGRAYAAEPVAKPDNGWLSPIVDSLDSILGNIESFYQGLGLPYAYGWSIISLTLFVKVLTLPLTKKQVESAMSVQALKPRIDIIKERYGDDKEKIQKETSRLYEQANVNPLAGCLPSLLQLPIYIGLFRSLNNIAMSGSLDNEGFFWIPSLAGPTAGSPDGGTSWLLPFVHGAPPIGWPEASLYLVLPVLLLAAQYASSAIISPVDPNDENANTQRILIYILPLTIGWFSLNVPSGLSLYYFSNSIFTSAQQIYFRKLGGVQVDTPDLGPVTKLGMGRRQGSVVTPPKAAAALPELDGNAALAAEMGMPSMPAAPAIQASRGDDATVSPSNGDDTRHAAAGAVNNGSGHTAAQDTQPDTEGIVGGLMVVEADMEGVAAEELEYLMKRCKRPKQTV
eukprot:jgi/Ulvmu1/1838/UM119_0057.1